jgi:broad specificity phosphatase PhoE
VGGQLPDVEEETSKPLNANGEAFGARLSAHVFKTIGKGQPVVAMSSTLPRAVSTAQYIINELPEGGVENWGSLGFLNTGICHGMKVADIKATMPEEYEKWTASPFTYRFPGGESMRDMNRRLADIVLEIERLQCPVVIVTHLTTIQSLLAYFTSTDVNQAHFIEAARHTAHCLTPSNYGWIKEDVKLG